MFLSNVSIFLPFRYPWNVFLCFGYWRYHHSFIFIYVVWSSLHSSLSRNSTLMHLLWKTWIFYLFAFRDLYETKRTILRAGFVRVFLFFFLQKIVSRFKLKVIYPNISHKIIQLFVMLKLIIIWATLSGQCHVICCLMCYPNHVVRLE